MLNLQRHPGDGGLPEQNRRTETALIDMAYAMGLPLVATNDVYFPKPEIYEAHDALICIAEGAYVDQQEPRRRLTPQHYFKSPQEMITLFADLPEAVENTIEIASAARSKRTSVTRSCPSLPMTRSQELRRQAHAGLQARWPSSPMRSPSKNMKSGSISSWISSKAWAFPVTF